MSTKHESLATRGRSITSIDSDSVAIIFTFLTFKDAAGVCRINKEAYENYMRICCASSFLSINVQKVPNAFLKKYYKYADALSGISKWKELPHCVPQPKLLSIEFGKKFDQPFDTRAKKILPLGTTIECIRFDARSKFNFTINVLGTLTHLKRIYFNKAFDKPIDILPDSVEVISFHKNSKFNKYVRKWPGSLRELYIGEAFNHDINNIPDGVRIIMFSNFSEFNCDIIKYPTELRKIHFGGAFNRDISPLASAEHLRELLFYKKSWFNQPITILPPNLIKISFGVYFDWSIDALARCTELKHIHFCMKAVFDRSIRHLPPSIRYIHFGRDFNSYLCDLPASIRHIKFRSCSRFCRPIVLPNIIDVLHLGRNFNAAIKCGYIKKLKVGTQVYNNINGRAHANAIIRMKSADRY